MTVFVRVVLVLIIEIIGNQGLNYYNERAKMNTYIHATRADEIHTHGRKPAPVKKTRKLGFSRNGGTVPAKREINHAFNG
ncbi:hypothetical protein C6499_19055 [Candidatus Poribacteria bacterium]|nr:MAG: hypothetical protein C6499_19055 [Candidatus Poribacteria bacterium]